MKKAILVMVVCFASIASADVTVGNKPMIFRQSADVYSVPGEGTIRTVACTVTADGNLSARVTGGSKPWLYFIDKQGRREADCQLAKVEPSKHSATAVAKR